MNIASTRHLFHPIVDVLLLGGASILAFVLIRSLHLSIDDVAVLAFVMLVVAHAVNHPHFAHSYQLFYGRLAELRSNAGTQSERLRVDAVAWWIPLLLIGFLAGSAWAWRTGERLPMGIMINLMGALVGWHYVKQGFGMAMTDAALKKTYWSPLARRKLLVNAYCCWVLAWAYLNSSGLGAQFWGLFHQRFAVPMPLVGGLAIVAFVTTIWTGVAVYREWLHHHAIGVPWVHMPWAGMVGYFVSLYLWTVFASVDPAYALVIPFFHSLQYLTIVYRCKLTELGERLKSVGGQLRLWGFALLGGVMGWLCFWLIPGYVDFQTVRWMWSEAPAPALTIACFWLFINVHHYFIDNVLWRATNPYVKSYLFGVTVPRASHDKQVIPPSNTMLSFKATSVSR